MNRGWGGGLLFVFRGDGSRAQKLENRWNCLNSFVRGCSLYSKDIVIGDTFGLVLGRDPLWSKRPIRKLKLLEWLTES